MKRTNGSRNAGGDTANQPPISDRDMAQARRRFLLRCGRYAVATPPLVTLLLAPEVTKYAVAQSGFLGGPRTNAPLGNGGGGGAYIPTGGSPTISGCQDLAPGSFGSNSAFCSVTKKQNDS
ncbi:MAG: hypothetical protein ACM30I_09575 [Gemmatimonas sp.]